MEPIESEKDFRLKNYVLKKTYIIIKYSQEYKDIMEKLKEAIETIMRDSTII